MRQHNFISTGPTISHHLYLLIHHSPPCPLIQHINILLALYIVLMNVNPIIACHNPCYHCAILMLAESIKICILYFCILYLKGLSGEMQQGSKIGSNDL
jgi:hypothetical protein